MVSKASIVSSLALISGLFLSATSVQSAPNYDYDPKDEVSKAELDGCLNANTLNHIRATFFAQTDQRGTIFPSDSQPKKGGAVTVFAYSSSTDGGRAATASLRSACRADPSFRIINPAIYAFDITKIKPNLDTPRALPLPEHKK